MTVLVTGAGGFLGRRLVIALAEAGYEVTAIDRIPCPPGLEENGKIRWRQLDLAQDHADLSQLLTAQTVFHLAGVKDINPGDDKSVFLEANEAITLRLLCALPSVTKKFVLASSQMVYGDPNNMSVTESFPLLGMNSSAYACSKLNAENWMQCLRKEGVNYLALRFCGFVEGGGAIDYMIDRALRHEPIELFSSGQTYRDYLSVADGIKAFLATMSYQAQSTFEAFNIGSGQTLNSMVMAQLICQELNSRSEIVLSKHPAPRANFVFDITKAVRQLGFVPGDLAIAVQNYARHRKCVHQEVGHGA